MKMTFGTRTAALRAAMVSAVLAFTTAAAAQSFNIDVDLPNSSPSLGSGPPSSGYGAASGQTGHWNAFPGTLIGSPFQLVDLSGGTLTAVTITRTTNTGSGSVLGFNNATFTGDYALLMKDAAQVGTTLQGGLNEYTFDNLADGRYEVWTYGAPPAGQAGFTPVEVIGSSDPIQILTGNAANNTFVFGETHAVHDVLVAGGSLVVRIDVPFDSGAPAYINGFQLIAVPAPGVLAVLLLPMMRRTRRR